MLHCIIRGPQQIDPADPQWKAATPFARYELLEANKADASSLWRVAEGPTDSAARTPRR